MLSQQKYTCSAKSLRQSITVVKKSGNSLMLTPRPLTRQQTRSFRLNVISSGSSHLDRNYKNVLQDNISKHKYAAALIEKLSWDQNNSSRSDVCGGFRSIMCGLRASRQMPIRVENRDWKDLYLGIQRFRANLQASVRVGSEVPASDPLRNTRTRANRIPESSFIAPTWSELHREKLRTHSRSKVPEAEPTYMIGAITNRNLWSTASKETSEKTHSSRKDTPAYTFALYRSPFFQDSVKSSSEVPAIKTPAIKTPAVQTPAIPTPVTCDVVQEALKEYDAKVAYYSHGTLYNVSKSNIDFQDAVQAGLKEHDDKISAKARQLGLHDVKGNGNTDYATSTNTQDDVHNIIHHYEATSEHSKELLRAIQQYESQRPKFAEGLLKSESKTHPLVQAIQEFEGAKIASGHQKMSDERIDPLLKTIHEYHEKLRLEKTAMQDSHGVVDRQLMDVLEPIEEYQKSLSRARYHPASVDGLKDYDAKVDYSRRRRDSILHPARKERIEDLDLLTASGIRAASGKLRQPRTESEAEKMTKRKELETAFEISQTQNTSKEESTAFEAVKKIRNSLSIDGPTSTLQGECTAASSVIVEADKLSVVRHRGLTGIFARDFPEEFETSWRSFEYGNIMPMSGSLESDFQIGQQGKSNVSRLETSLDRAAQNATQRIASSVDQLLTSTTATPDTFQKRPEPIETTLYKILAYDPTMQSIDSAETTSIVSDSATPLTPAEVLLRLSNPAKFFPHFAPLQAQGYEVVSGSGDVLVFRKVRSSAPELEIPVQAQPLSQEAVRKAITNPIDGMQRSATAHAATGDYASPTGFVNHDVPRGLKSATPYNVDVRREEPVFSGGKRGWEGKEGEKPRRKGRGRKVLVSAVWVAGCCYAVGVVTEFFRDGTGGLEGF